MPGVDAVQDLLAGYPPQVRLLVEALRILVREAAPGLTERVRLGWRNIGYEHSGIVCYIAPLKDSVNLGFYKGTSLPDAEGLLLGTGKELRHVKVRSLDDVRVEPFTRLVREAYRLNLG